MHDRVQRRAEGREKRNPRGYDAWIDNIGHSEARAPMQG